MLAFRAGIHKTLVRIANREDPDQTASSEAVWSVCLGLFDRQQVFEILEHFLYIKLLDQAVTLRYEYYHLEVTAWSKHFHLYITAVGLHNWELQITWRTSDGGNGNHSVSLPIILIKIKVDQMPPSSYINLLLVFILWFCICFLYSVNVRLYFGAKMVTFCIIDIGNRKIFLKHHSPPSPN